MLCVNLNLVLHEASDQKFLIKNNLMINLVQIFVHGKKKVEFITRQCLIKCKRSTVIRINLDGWASGYAENPDDLIFS
jgi:hypothetical protein